MAVFGSRRFLPVTIKGEQIAESLELWIEGVLEQAGVGKLKVTGNLTIRGVTKEVVLDVDGPTAAVKDPWGNQRAAVNATTKINRQDYGVKWNATMDNGGVVVGDDVSINIDAEMIQKGAAKSGN